MTDPTPTPLARLRREQNRAVAAFDGHTSGLDRTMTALSCIHNVIDALLDLHGGGAEAVGAANSEGWTVTIRTVTQEEIDRLRASGHLNYTVADRTATRDAATERVNDRLEHMAGGGTQATDETADRRGREAVADPMASIRGDMDAFSNLPPRVVEHERYHNPTAGGGEPADADQERHQDKSSATVPPAPPDAICGYPFDGTSCVAVAGHDGPHMTSSERFPHGRTPDAEPAWSNQLRGAFGAATTLTGVRPDAWSWHEANAKALRAAINFDLDTATRRVRELEGELEAAEQRVKILSQAGSVEGVVVRTDTGSGLPRLTISLPAAIASGTRVRVLSLPARTPSTEPEDSAQSDGQP